ncbi:MAG: protein kinase, partial [Micrococcales bacterium]|nr:protein kinase [Micrococcales bacterium]
MAVNDRLVGDVLDGRYEITNRIGRGGMATVYRAKDRRLNRIVAVKIMREDVDDDPENARRFDSEARAVAMLSDAHIVSVFDQGTDRDRPYIVMECVDGTNLKAIIVKQGALPLARALPLFEAIVSGLAVAHAAGIIHRDIKPENVLIGRSGEAKVTDFGLARHSDVSAMTVAEGVLGSLSYVSPERLLHKAPVDFRSDIYSVGIVAFEMLTGRKPFDGDQGAVVTQHLQCDVPAPRTVNASIPVWLDTLVTACGRRDPNERPVDGRYLLNRLRRGIEAMRHGTQDDPELIAWMAAPGAATIPSRLSEEAPSTGILPPVAHEDTPANRIKPAGRVPTKRQQPNFTVRRVFVAILTVALLIAGAVAGWWTTSGRFTTMPEIVGLTQSAANAVLSNSGLKLATEKDFSETVPAGSVISSRPEAGSRVLRGATVQAIISQGPER